jgi:hypothetical protein
VGRASGAATRQQRSIAHQPHAPAHLHAPRRPPACPQRASGALALSRITIGAIEDLVGATRLGGAPGRPLRVGLKGARQAGGLQLPGPSARATRRRQMPTGGLARRPPPTPARSTAPAPSTTPRPTPTPAARGSSAPSPPRQRPPKTSTSGRPRPRCSSCRAPPRSPWSRPASTPRSCPSARRYLASTGAARRPARSRPRCAPRRPPRAAAGSREDRARPCPGPGPPCLSPPQATHRVDQLRAPAPSLGAPTGAVHFACPAAPSPAPLPLPRGRARSVRSAGFISAHPPFVLCALTWDGPSLARLLLLAPATTPTAAHLQPHTPSSLARPRTPRIALSRAHALCRRRSRRRGAALPRTATPEAVPPQRPHQDLRPRSRSAAAAQRRPTPLTPGRGTPGRVRGPCTFIVAHTTRHQPAGRRGRAAG